MQTELSIIVPVYNAERYLQKCIESILNQKMSDFELLLVDDGSTDSSGKICDEYSEKDSRVTVMHILNGGPANARNEALKTANGKYIGFVDSDDWIEPDMYERLCKNAAETSADLVFCDYIAETSAGSVVEFALFSTQEIFYRDAIENLFLPYFFGYTDSELKDFKKYCPFADYHSYIWLCIYKAEALKNAGLTIPDDRIYFNEDNLFNLSFLIFAKSISHVNRHLYHYLYNSASFTKKFDARYWEMKLNKFHYLKNIIAENKLDDDYLKRLDNKISLDCVSVINYYASSRYLKFREKREWVKSVACSIEMLNALKSFNFKAMPLSKTKVFLVLCRVRAYRTIVLIASVYRRLVGNRNI